MQQTELNSAFLQYLLDQDIAPGQHLPTLNDISQALGISVGKLREELEVARSMDWYRSDPVWESSVNPLTFRR